MKVIHCAYDIYIEKWELEKNSWHPSVVLFYTLDHFWTEIALEWAYDNFIAF